MTKLVLNFIEHEKISCYISIKRGSQKVNTISEASSQIVTQLVNMFNLYFLLPTIN
jgi:hypothetical protein